MDITTMEPKGLEPIERVPVRQTGACVFQQLSSVFPSSLKVSQELDIEHWGWVDQLVRGFTSGEEEAGRLIRAHYLNSISTSNDSMKHVDPMKKAGQRQRCR